MSSLLQNIHTVKYKNYMHKICHIHKHYGLVSYMFVIYSLRTIIYIFFNLGLKASFKFLIDSQNLHMYFSFIPPQYKLCSTDRSFGLKFNYAALKYFMP
jgi:hypothetical protein